MQGASGTAFPLPGSRWSRALGTDVPQSRSGRVSPLSAEKRPSSSDPKPALQLGPEAPNRISYFSASLFLKKQNETASQSAQEDGAGKASASRS